MTSRLTPKPPQTEAMILETLDQWRDRLHEAQAGCNMPTETECRTQLDRWLEEYALYLRLSDTIESFP